MKNHGKDLRSARKGPALRLRSDNSREREYDNRYLLDIEYAIFLVAIADSRDRSATSPDTAMNPATAQSSTSP